MRTAAPRFWRPTVRGIALAMVLLALAVGFCAFDDDGDDHHRVARGGTDLDAGMAMGHPPRMASTTLRRITTVEANIADLTDVVARLKDGGMIVSAFIDAEAKQVEASKQAGFDVCEVHTGPYAHAFANAGGDFLVPALADELAAVRHAGRLIRSLGMRFNAGHALNYHNVKPIATLEAVAELHIGHAIVSRAVFTGLRDAVREMKRLMVQTASCRSG